MNTFKIGAVATLALAATAASQAQAQDFYASAAAGILKPQHSDVTVGTANGSAKYDTGSSFQAALGYDLGTGLRTELELGINDSGFKNVRTATGTTGVAGGDVDQLTLHAAAYYDFNAGGLSPYVGGGLGLTRTDVDAGTVGVAAFTGDRNTDFSAFGEAGLSVPITDRLSIAPGVRYSWVDTSGDNFGAWTFRTALRFAF